MAKLETDDSAKVYFEKELVRSNVDKTEHEFRAKRWWRKWWRGSKTNYPYNNVKTLEKGISDWVLREMRRPNAHASSSAPSPQTRRLLTLIETYIFTRKS